ncbi:hypothetical protein POM88_041020 [Heracleum sosnowskyi]|uniref:Uncharacterized protein n=1 Tax=Heracleum sosnowskyi TaxID=360622 RepID=A0AAD8HFN3_9APIA|nr:hypothetical protein POM88_041020 [Heracleum sosnowskyi]
MAEELDDGEFWLPPQFLSDQDDLVTDLTRPNSDVSESSDDDDYLLLGLTRKFSLSDNKRSSESPQSTLYNQGCSPHSTSPLLGQNQTPPCGLIFAAAGQVAKIRHTQQPNFGPLNPVSYRQVQGNQLKQQQGNLRRGQQQMSPRNKGGNASNGRPLGLSPYVWPPLQQSRHPQQIQRQHYAWGMRPVFLKYPSTNGKCSGTGVFLPRPVATPTQTLNKPACSTVLVPDRVVPALNLNLEAMDASAQPQDKSNTRNAAIFPSDHDAAGKYQNRVLMDETQAQQRRNVAAIGPQVAPISNEVKLPQEWAY